MVASKRGFVDAGCATGREKLTILKKNIAPLPWYSLQGSAEMKKNDS
jgi:hypothetical protein